MKFSEITEEQWEELKPYLDTALLPVTGLTGREEPWKAAEELEALRDALDLIEIPFKGRVVTYPALHYNADDAPGMGQVAQVCEGMFRAGFKYVIAVTARTEAELSLAGRIPAQLIVQAPAEVLRSDAADMKRKVSEDIQRLWHSDV